MKTFKTSTKISFNFIIYFVIIVIFGVTVNFFYFYSWESHSYNEIRDTLNREYNEIFVKDKTKSEEQKLTKFKEDIFDIWWFIIDNSWKIYLPDWYTTIPETNIFNIFKKDSKYFLIGWVYFPRIWNVFLFYNTYSLYESQIILFKISIIMLLFFSILGLLFSKYLINTSLKNLQLIADFAKNLDFDNMNENIQIDWREDDEIKIVSDALNKAIYKINYKAQKLKDFSSDVAHEFKTSLMIVNSEIDYANAAREYEESFMNIKAQVKYLDYLINSLLSLTRLEGKDIKKTQENIWAILKSSITELDWVFKTKWLAFSSQIEGGVTKKIDKSLFTIVINNLIFNAFKYTNSGKIEVILTQDYIEIKDSWIWIKKENLDKIWIRYYKEDWQVNNNSHWLWLSLVKEIIDKHNFKIEVESDLWVGSTFRIYF